MTIQVNKETESSENPLQTIELHSPLSFQSVGFVEGLISHAEHKRVQT
jgi:hypothetical protein